MISSSPFFQSASIQGPEPTGLFEMSSSFAPLNTFSGMTLFENSEMSARKGAHGSFRLMTTVKSSLAWMSSTASSAHFHGPLVSRARFRDHTASEALTMSPLENLAFFLRLNVHVRPSDDVDHFSARSGSKPSPLTFTRTSCW